MITLLSGGFPDFEDSVFSLRQRAYFNAYGADTPFFTVWTQKNNDGEITAVISSLSGDITLSLDESADFDEIKSFLYTVGFSSVFFNAAFADRLCLKNAVKGRIMRLETVISAEVPDLSEPDYRQVFDLIFESEEASFGDWFTDLAHKIRRGCADITTKRVDGRTVACAACVAKTDTAALIGFVKTAADYRRRGYGTELVKSLCAFLQSGGRQVFLCREENKNEKFYSQIGFADCGEWMTAKNG